MKEISESNVLATAAENNPNPQNVSTVAVAAPDETQVVLPVPTRTIPQYSFRAMEKAGYKFAIDHENRLIHSAHIDELYKRVKNSPGKFFYNPGMVVKAIDALEQGRRVFDIDGNELTLKTKGIDCYVVVIDMQHRLAVMLEHPEIDCLVEILPGNIDIADYIDQFNNSGLKWNGNDVKNSIKNHFDNKGVDVLVAIDNYKTQFPGCTDKYAEMALTGKKDQFRLADMKALQADYSKYDAEKFQITQSQIQQAHRIMFATLCQFGNKERKIRKIEYQEAIHSIQETLSTKKAENFDENIVSFINNMADDAKCGILKKIEEKDNKLNAFVTKSYNTFVESKSDEELQHLYTEALEAIEKKEAELSGSSSSTLKIKVGSLKEVLGNRKAMIAEKAQKAAEKAEKAAAKAATQVEAKPATDEIADDTSAPTKEVAADADTSVNSENKAQ